MIHWNKLGHFRELSYYNEPLNHAMEVNSPHTNSPQLYVVQNNLIE